MADWTFLTNYGLVLSYIARHPRSTTREIANAVGITERTTHKIIADLDSAGYIIRQRSGRQNIYEVDRTLPLRHPTHQKAIVGDLLSALAPPRGRRRRP